MAPRKTASLSFRTTKEVRERLEVLARRNGRSLAEEVEAHLINSLVQWPPPLCIEKPKDYQEAFVR